MTFHAAGGQLGAGPFSWLATHWDANWFWALVALLFGLLAGYKGIYDKYGIFAGSVVRSGWAIFYLLIRGVVPAVVFIGIYSTGYFKGWFPVWAAITGVGVEGVLRLGFLWKQKQLTADGAGSEDLLVGPFQILNWFQNHCLENAKGAYQDAANAAADGAINDAEAAVNGATFSELLGRAELNAEGYDGEIRDQLKAQMAKLKMEFAGEPTPHAADLDKKYCYKLAYAMLGIVKSRGMNRLLRKKTI